MKKLFGIVALVAMLLWSVGVFAAGTCTVTEPPKVDKGHSVKITFSWTSDSNGDVSASAARTTYEYEGYIVRVVTDPDDTDAPTDDYDIDIQDDDACDVLGAAGDNRDTANVEQTAPLMGGTTYGRVFFRGRLALVVSAAGDTKKGVVYVYVIREL